MHNAKCIMHNYLFLIVGAAIGSPYGNTFCNGRPMGAPTFSHQAFKDLDKLLFVYTKKQPPLRTADDFVQLLCEVNEVCVLDNVCSCCSSGALAAVADSDAHDLTCD